MAGLLLVDTLLAAGREGTVLVVRTVAPAATATPLLTGPTRFFDTHGTELFVVVDVVIELLGESAPIIKIKKKNVIFWE